MTFPVLSSVPTLQDTWTQVNDIFVSQVFLSVLFSIQIIISTEGACQPD